MDVQYDFVRIREQVKNTSRPTMKLPVLCLAVLSSTLAVPNGYYHQEYNYKTSSSSFKNNELQHKTDDQGYFKKDGDLDGQTKPRVDANSEHTEYVNPNLRNSQYGSQYTGGYGSDSDLSSSGVMRATNDYSGYDTNSLAVDGLARSDRLVGSRGYSSGYSSGYGSNSYGSSSSTSASNIRVLTSRLQQDLENDLREAIRVNNMYAQSRVNMAQLEDELRRNLTERLNSELVTRYGQQMIRNGMSYSLDGGRLHSTANYNNQELNDLKNQVENSLLDQLRTQYHSSSSSSNQYYSQQNQQGTYGYSTTVRPSYLRIYPSLPANDNSRPVYQTMNSDYQTVNTNTRYTPVIHPESITSIASRVQNEMDQNLNQLLDETKRKYFSSGSTYYLTNTDVLLERLRNELRSNLTYLLDENIRRNYGTQQLKNGYMYSLGSSGQVSSEYNYALSDLENLKAQVERNLINKLNRDIESYKTSWSSQQSYLSQSSYGNSYAYSSTPQNYEVYTTPRSSIYSLYTSPPTHGSNYVNNGGYNYQEGSRSSGYEAQSSGYGVQSSGNIAQLQQNLQQQLSRQLQAAINKEQHSTYSTSANGYNPSNYQSSLQELSNELNRNLTRNLQEYSASGSYAAYGNFDSAQMERLRTQLQESLMNQLRQGLQRSFESHNSYSGSSSSNYRSVRGFQNQQQNIAGEDCDGYHGYRAKRSHRTHTHYTGYEKNREEFGRHVELGQDLESSDLQQEQLEEVGQQIEDFNSNQPAENVGYGRFSVNNQNQEPSETGQQIEDDDSTRYGNLLLPNQELIGQQDDLTQQVEGSVYGKLQSQSQYQSPIEAGQQIEDDDSTRYGNLLLPNQELMGQQADLTQQVEGSVYGKLQSQSQYQSPIEAGQQIEDDDSTKHGNLLLPNQELIGQQADLTQQVEDSSYGKLQSQSQYQSPIEAGQQIEDDDSTKHGNLLVPNQELIGQQTDLGQQVEGSVYGKLQSQSQYQSPIEAGQQIEEDDSTRNGNLLLPNQELIGQQADLSQQVEGSSFGKLPFQSHYRSPNEAGQQVENENTDIGKLLLLNQEQQSDIQENEHVIQVEQVEEDVDRSKITKSEPIGQQSDDLIINHRMEESHTTQVPQKQVDQQTGNHRDCQQVGKSVDQIEDNHSVSLMEPKPCDIQHVIYVTNWCDKYVDTSYMDAPWSLGKEMKENISKIISQNDGITADSSYILEKVLAGIPKEMLERCFEVQKIELKYQGTVLAGLNEYLKTLIRNQINEALKKNIQNPGNKQVNLPANHNEITINQEQPKTPIEVSNNSDDWCSQYVDISVTNTAWSISKNLKNDIAKKVSQGDDPEVTYNKVSSEIPDEMLRKCFRIDTIESNEQKIVLAGIEDYFQSLIRKEIDVTIKNQKNVETSARPNNQLSNQDPVSTQTIAEAEQFGDSLIDALSKHTHNRPSIVQEAPLYESSNPQSGTIGSNYHGNYGNNRGIDAPSGNDMMYVHRFETRYENHNPPYRKFGSYHNQLVNPYPNVPGPHGYHSQIPQSRVVEQNLEPKYADHRYLHSYNYYQNQFGGRYEQFDEGAVKVQHRPVYSGIKGRRVQQPNLIHKPVQEPIQEIPVQELVLQPVHKSVQEPIITPVVVAPFESGNLDGKPERIVEPEQTEVSTEAPEELSWWKRFGNKVKQGAQNLKEKMIG